MTEANFTDRGSLEAESARRSRYFYLGRGVGMAIVLGRLKMYVPTRDASLVPHLISVGHWEAWISAFVCKVVKRGAVCLDVGSNVGYYTLLMSGICGAARAVAIEANAELARLTFLSAAVNGLEGVHVFNRAAWGSSHQEVFLSNPGHFTGGASVSAVNSEAGQTPTRTISIDDAVDDLKLERVDFAKVDVEGAEPEVLKGMARTIAANPGLRILLEHSDNHDPGFFEELQGRFHVRRVNERGDAESCPWRPKGVQMLYLEARR